MNRCLKLEKYSNVPLYPLPNPIDTNYTNVKVPRLDHCENGCHTIFSFFGHGRLLSLTKVQ